MDDNTDKMQQVRDVVYDNTAAAMSFNGTTDVSNKVLGALEHVWDHTPLHSVIGIVPSTGPVGVLNFFSYTKKDNDVLTLDSVSQVYEVGSLPLLSAVLPIYTKHSLAFDIAYAVTTQIVEYIEKYAASDRPTKLATKTASPQISTLMDKNIAMDDLFLLVNQQANQIARDTRRGAGNCMIVGMDVVKTMRSCNAHHEVTWKPSALRGVPSLFEIGTFGGRFKVFGSDAIDSSEVIVGYTRETRFNLVLDAGFAYCPYVFHVTPDDILHHRFGLALNDNLDAKYYRKRSIGGLLKCSVDEQGAIYEQLMANGTSNQ